MKRYVCSGNDCPSCCVRPGHHQYLAQKTINALPWNAPVGTPKSCKVPTAIAIRSIARFEGGKQGSGPPDHMPSVMTT